MITKEEESSARLELTTNVAKLKSEVANSVNLQETSRGPLHV